MRFQRLCRWIGICACATALATAAAAGQAERFELSVVAEPGASYSDYEGFDVDLGFGVGVGWLLAEPWSVELRGLFAEGDVVDVETFQLGLRRGFPGAGAWRPFVQAGLHFQRSELEIEVFCIQAPCPPLEERHEDFGVYAGGGVDWGFARRAALRLDGRLAVYDSGRSGGTEDTLDVTAGLVVRF
jgi:hypothetical protein